MTKNELAAMIDHTVLKPAAGEKEILQLCKEAKEFCFASVCIHPAYISLAKEALADSSVELCTVIGFPLGANTVAVKAFEAKEAVQNGATEIDMVLNVSKVKSGDFDYIENEIREVVKASDGNHVKVIIETCYLTDEEKIKTCQRAEKAGAHFVKTSTGFGSGGATAEDVKLMRETVGDRLGVKASGGIRTLEDALKMVEAGASRLGVSAGIAILSEMME